MNPQKVLPLAKIALESETLRDLEACNGALVHYNPVLSPSQLPASGLTSSKLSFDI
jgi:hypothetical protein